MNSDAIAKSSPLYEYWKTSQDNQDEAKRLLMLNNKSFASKLFKEEPYKWEVLYQSIIREIYKGDKTSVKGLKILLQSLNKQNEKDTLNRLKYLGLINQETFHFISNYDLKKEELNRNLYRFLRVLFSIFFNPYGIVIRRKKNHLYENTASFIHQIREIFIR